MKILKRVLVVLLIMVLSVVGGFAGSHITIPNVFAKEEPKVEIDKLSMIQNTVVDKYGIDNGYTYGQVINNIMEEPKWELDSDGNVTVIGWASIDVNSYEFKFTFTEAGVIGTRSGNTLTVTEVHNFMYIATKTYSHDRADCIDPSLSFEERNLERVKRCHLSGANIDLYMTVESFDDAFNTFFSNAKWTTSMHCTQYSLTGTNHNMSVPYYGNYNVLMRYNIATRTCQVITIQINNKDLDNVSMYKALSLIF